MLIDSFHRQVNYLRISVTDRCDLRCRYCMNEHMTFLAREHILSLEEIESVARAFVELGVSKIRITGGEPLVRKGIVSLLQALGSLEGLTQLVMTTNGVSLEPYAQQIRDAGVTRINISLDSLQEERFKDITRVGELERVLKGIEAAKAAGFERIKLNAVIMKGFNDSEVLDLFNFAMQQGLDISYIEEMPLGHISSHQRNLSSISSDEIFDTLSKHYRFDEIKNAPESITDDGPARKFKVAGFNNQLGLISPHSHNFCSSCNRVRISAEGRLLLCLGNEHSVDLKAILRAPGQSQSAVFEALKMAIQQSMFIKPERHEFDLNAEPQIVRFMNMTGG